MTEEEAIEDAKNDFAEKFPHFKDDLVFMAPEKIIKGQYKPFCCYAITVDGSFIVTDFLVTLTSKGRADGYPYFIYTVYDQALGKYGIYKFYTYIFRRYSSFLRIIYCIEN